MNSNDCRLGHSKNQDYFVILLLVWQLVDGCASFDAEIDWFTSISRRMRYHMINLRVNVTADVVEQGTGEHL